MGLITETNQQYYTGTQVFSEDGTNQTTFTCTFDTNLIYYTNDTTDSNYPLNNFTIEYYNPNVTPTAYAPYTIQENSDYKIFSVIDNIITIDIAGTGLATSGHLKIVLKDSALYYNYGGYSYVTLNDIVNNFLIGYVGTDKLIQSVKRTDVLFHAKRGLQEFSYDTLKSIKSQELVVPSSLSVVIPQDYVNYVKLSRIDDSGVKRIIYPTRLTSNPIEILVQDTDGIPTQNSSDVSTDTKPFGVNKQTTSTAESGWSGLDPIDSDYDTNKQLLGQRFGLDPETTQVNDWFTINEREHKISFSSGLSGDTIILEYISDGLAYDNDTRIPKLAEEAMYMHIAYSILAGRIKQPEYIVKRFKKDRRAALRNAKLRLSNIKLEEITQVFKGKSKQIK